MLVRRSMDTERLAGAGLYRLEATGVQHVLARPELDEGRLVAIGALLRHAATLMRCANRSDGRSPATAGGS